MTAAIRHSLGNTKNWLKYYWKTLLIVSLIVMALCGLVYAGSVTPHEGGDSFLDNMVDTIFNVSRMDDLSNKLVVVFSDDMKKSQIYGYEVNLGGFINTIYSLSAAVAICFVCVTFFTGLMSIRAADITEEMVFRKFILFAVSMALCANAGRIVINVANMGSAVTAEVAKDYTSPGGEAADSVQTLKNAIYYNTHTAKYSKKDIPSYLDSWVDKENFADDLEALKWHQKPAYWLHDAGQTIGYTMDFILPWLMSWLTTAFINFIVASRSIEIVLMIAFSPLMFMDSASLEDFSHSSAWRYLKTVLAISLQGAVIIGVIIIGSGMMTAVLVDVAKIDGTGNIGSVLGNMVLIMFTEAGMCMKSGQLARTIVSAG